MLPDKPAAARGKAMLPVAQALTPGFQKVITASESERHVRSTDQRQTVSCGCVALPVVARVQSETDCYSKCTGRQVELSSHHPDRTAPPPKRLLPSPPPPPLPPPCSSALQRPGRVGAAPGTAGGWRFGSRARCSAGGRPCLLHPCQLGRPTAAAGAFQRGEDSSRASFRASTLTARGG